MERLDELSDWYDHMEYEDPSDPFRAGLRVAEMLDADGEFVTNGVWLGRAEELNRHFDDAERETETEYWQRFGTAVYVSAEEHPHWNWQQIVQAAGFAPVHENVVRAQRLLSDVLQAAR